MTYENGQLIEHPTFGRGKIVAVDGDKVRVIFKSDPHPKLLDTARFPLALASEQSDPYFDRVTLPAARSKRGGSAVKSTVSHAEARNRFVAKFPQGFQDPAYRAAERDYKLAAVAAWREQLSRAEMERLLAAGDFAEVAARAMRIEAMTNLLDVFAKAALRNAAHGDPEAFARALFAVVHGEGDAPARFQAFASALEKLPQPKTSTHQWPIQTIFPFLADPGQHIFVKPKVTQLAAERFKFDLGYRPQPAWDVYARILQFAAELRADLADLQPQDMVDIQSFLWVTGRMEEGKYEGTPAKGHEQVAAAES